MQRLRRVAADAGRSITRHSFINPDDAAAILAEFDRLQDALARAVNPPGDPDPGP